MTTTIYYNPQGDDTGYRYKVTPLVDYDLSDAIDVAHLAEQCADDWHTNNDGFERAWPRVFSLYVDKSGPAIARFEIDREYEPTFNAVPC